MCKYSERPERHKENELAFVYSSNAPRLIHSKIWTYSLIQ